MFLSIKFGLRDRVWPSTSLNKVCISTGQRGKLGLMKKLTSDRFLPPRFARPRLIYFGEFFGHVGPENAFKLTSSVGSVPC